jgi:hypothetical protein
MSEIHPADTSYAELQRHLRESATLASAAAVLGWDQETYMPAECRRLRGEQMAALSADRARAPHLRARGRADRGVRGDPSLLADAEAQANLRALRPRLRPRHAHPHLAGALLCADHVARHARVARAREAGTSRLRALAAGGGGPEPRAGGALGVPPAARRTTRSWRTTSRDDRRRDPPHLRRAARRPGAADPRVAVGPRPDDAWQRTPVPIERQVAFNRG